MLQSIAAPYREYRPLLPLEAAFSLSAGDSPPISEVAVHNGQATAGLTATLERPEASQLLSALSGKEGPLGVGVMLSYRAAWTNPPSRFSMELEAVYRFLSGVVGPDRVLYEKDLENYILPMMERGVLCNEDPAASTPANLSLAKQILPSFLQATSVLLDRVTIDDPSTELGRMYILSSRTPPTMSMHFQLGKASSMSPGTLELRAPLHRLLPEALRGEDLDALIHMVTIDENGRGIGEVPRRVRNRSARVRSAEAEVAIVQIGRTIRSLSEAVRPSVRTSLGAHSILAEHQLPSNLGHLVTNGVTIPQSSENLRHLPVVSDSDLGLWPDRIDGNHRFWYAPEFEIVQPRSPSQPDDSPFLFSFLTVGHDSDGQPGLEAVVRVTLRRIMPEEARRRLEGIGDVPTDPVKMKNLSFRLEVPFRDEDRSIRRERCPSASAEVSGDLIVVTFQFLDDWVRMCYGALAYENYQPGEPARISIAYAFDAYTLLTNYHFQLMSGGKTLRVPLARSTKDRNRLGGQLHVDAKRGSIRYRGAELSFSSPSKPQSARARPGTTLVSLASPHIAPPLSAPVVRPEAHLNPAILEALQPKQYGKVEKLKSFISELLVPCNEFGALYVEDTDNGHRAIGCQDTFRLGETRYRLYEELPRSRTGCRIFRSLQSPGRFLIVPEKYCIGRYGSSDGEQAYRPLVLLYSTIDVEDLESSRCVIMATLQPYLTLSERQTLLEELETSYHPSPIVEYITQVEGEFTFDWALPTGGANSLLRLEVEANRLSDSFQVSFSTDALGIPQLQAILAASGVSGSARLQLPDGTSLRTDLQIHLGRIVGPWENGPLEIRIDTNGATLVNRIESVVNVMELQVIEDGAVRSSIPVETRLEAQGQVLVPLPPGASDVLPVYSVESSAESLTEIRSFIEDIDLNLVLMNRIDFESLNLKSVSIAGHVKNFPGEAQATFAPSSEAVASLDFTLPLTVCLADPILELQATVTGVNNEERQLATREWDFSTQGAIVEITAATIGLEN